MGNFEVKKVLERKDGIRFVIIPKGFDVKKGELVLIKKIDLTQEVKNE